MTAGLPVLVRPVKRFRSRGMAGVERLQPSARRRMAVDEREVRLLDGARLERVLERLEGGVVLGDDEAARRLLVEAVDDARPENAADAREPRDVVQERVDQGPPGVPGGRMDHEPGRLVEDEQVAVLVEDGERQVLGLGNGGRGWWHRDLDALPALEPERRAARPSVDEHPSGLEQRLDARPAERGKARRDRPVETLASERWPGDEPVHLARGRLAPLWTGAHASGGVYPRAGSPLPDTLGDREAIATPHVLSVTAPRNFNGLE